MQQDRAGPGEEGGGPRGGRRRPFRAFSRVISRVVSPGPCAGAGLLAALLLSGCGTGSPVGVLDSLLTASPQVAVPPVLLVSEDDPRPWPLDPWTFQAHAFEGDTLALSIQYGGGCRVHRFALLVDPAFRESHPVQASARLAHDADGDPCRALLAEELRFDLGPLRRHYQASYQQPSGTISIFLEGRRIIYEF